MRLPPEILRLMDTVEYAAAEWDHAGTLEVAVEDLLTELRRLHNEKPADPETTHALRRVPS